MKHTKSTIGRVLPGARAGSGLRQHAGLRDSLRGMLEGRWEAVCYRRGNIVWVDHAKNIITNAGLDHLLDVTLSGGTQDTAWWVGLVDNSGFTSFAAGDTMASHAGWTEFTTYTGDRKAWTDGGVSGQSVDNSASKASFAITGTATLKGAFLSAEESLNSGVLFAEVAFSATRDVQNGDTLEVTYTITAADDGV